MGSVYIPSGKKIRGFGGKKHDDHVYFQFVPGLVVSVCTSIDSEYTFGQETNINSIIAIPHISDKATNRRLTLDETNRYKPLLRGMTDVPAKGDPVLLCTFQQRQYYLGPINTINSPNYNPDLDKKPEVPLSTSFPNSIKQSEIAGKSQRFRYQNQGRLIKKLNRVLDDPQDLYQPTKENHGDMMFEGRHGNSIRIGSRANNPYIFISNNRDLQNHMEGHMDGGLISITSNGTLHQHFGVYRSKDRETDVFQFQLESDKSPFTEETGTTIEKVVSNLNGGLDGKGIIYDYDQDQMLLHSDRIIINSRYDSMFLSSRLNLHMGAGMNMTISSGMDIIFEGRKTYLGNPFKGTNTNDYRDDMEAMVLGNKLLQVLNDLVVCLSDGMFTSPAGAPLPIHDAMMTPLFQSNPARQRKGLNDIKSDLLTILSNIHFIEPNKT